MDELIEQIKKLRKIVHEITKLALEIGTLLSVLKLIVDSF